MPKRVTVKYKFTGPAVVTVYTESEMAEGLGISVGELAERLKGSAYRLSYHAHSLATGEGYWFTPKIYQENIAKTKCVDSGGHHWQHSHSLGKNRWAWHCTDCPATKYD